MPNQNSVHVDGLPHTGTRQTEVSSPATGGNQMGMSATDRKKRTMFETPGFKSLTGIVSGVVTGIVLSVGLMMAPSEALANGAQGAKSGGEAKNRAPVSSDVLQVKFPRPQEFKLSNGLTVLVLEDHRLPTVLFQMFIPRGSLSEDPKLPGLANFTADLLKEGAGKWSSLDIAEALEDNGATFFASAGYGANVTNVGISGLSENTTPILNIFSEIFLNPTFPAEEIEKYRSREVAALGQKRASPAFLASERFMKSLYDGHPMQVTAPTEASLKAFTREDLLKFRKDNYVPKGAVLAVTGDVVTKEMVKQLEKTFKSWKTQAPAAAALPVIKPSSQLQISLVNRPGSVQTNLMMGNVGLTRTDPDYAAVTVMSYIFGASSSSRLFMVLREEKGYTYGAYASFNMTEMPGPWNANAEVRTDVTEPAMGEFITQINRIRSEPVSQQELDNARRALTARFALSLERAQALTNRALELKRYGLAADYWDKYPELVNAVTIADVQRVAQKYLDSSKMQVVAVGDADKIRDGLKKFGTVTEFDVAGNKVSQ